MNLLMRDHKDSLESIQYGGRFVTLVGKGILKSPGHPAGNQQYYNQLDILRNSSIKPYLFNIFRRSLHNKTTFLGMYTLHDYKIKESFEGFRYFEFKFLIYKKASTEECIFPS